MRFLLPRRWPATLSYTRSPFSVARKNVARAIRCDARGLPDVNAQPKIQLSRIDGAGTAARALITHGRLENALA